jgi:hypothetical protein
MKFLSLARSLTLVASVLGASSSSLLRDSPGTDQTKPRSCTRPLDRRLMMMIDEHLEMSICGRQYEVLSAHPSCMSSPSLQSQTPLTWQRHPSMTTFIFAVNRF